MQALLIDHRAAQHGLHRLDLGREAERIGQVLPDAASYADLVVQGHSPVLVMVRVRWVTASSLRRDDSRRASPATRARSCRRSSGPARCAPSGPRERRRGRADRTPAGTGSARSSAISKRVRRCAARRCRTATAACSLADRSRSSGLDRRRRAEVGDPAVALGERDPERDQVEHRSSRGAHASTTTGPLTRSHPRAWASRRSSSSEVAKRSAPLVRRLEPVQQRPADVADEQARARARRTPRRAGCAPIAGESA